ncbi:MAG TPA: phosphatase PAP2 family protein [Polyangiaceae bacterium]|nr:phosphatase PAP2 family protein [Polyangiaceae bacterium]
MCYFRRSVEPQPASSLQIRVYERLAAAAWVYLLYFGGYGLVNRRLRIADCTDLTLSLDRYIPFLSEFVAPFYLAYLIVLVPALVIRDRRLLGHAVVAFTALVLLSCLLFVLFPTYVPRPTIAGSSLSDALVGAIYAADRPSCAFPSLHVSSVALSALVLRRESRRYGRLLWPCVGLVALSTLFIKQHVVLDVLGGLGVAAGVEWATFRYFWRTAPERLLA